MADAIREEIRFLGTLYPAGSQLPSVVNLAPAVLVFNNRLNIVQVEALPDRKYRISARDKPNGKAQYVTQLKVKNLMGEAELTELEILAFLAEVRALWEQSYEDLLPGAIMSRPPLLVVYCNDDPAVLEAADPDFVRVYQVIDGGRLYTN